MRALPLMLLLALPFHPGTATAETLSQQIGSTGLAPTAVRLAALPAPTDADRFALAGVRFLGAIESALQLRWKAGLVDRIGVLPFLRIPIDENPTPAAFDPAMISRMFSGVETAMATVRAPLADIAQGSDVAMEINFADLWFDINANLARDPGEDMMAVLGPMLLGWQWDSRDPATPAPVVQFDAADAAWLSAYSHLLQAVAQMVLAYDPTEPTARIAAARDTMSQLGVINPDWIMGGGAVDGLDTTDLVAIILASLQQTPNAAKMAAARENLQAMVADNRAFWAAVEAETDNKAEWLPNDRQVSALGITLPQGTGAVWQGVLADAESLLDGTKLAPYWRFSGPAGINVAKMFTEPRPIDIPGWLQGWAAAPYLQSGELVSLQSWQAFENLVGGEAMLLSLYLN